MLTRLMMVVAACQNNIVMSPAMPAKLCVFVQCRAQLVLGPLVTFDPSLILYLRTENLPCALYLNLKRFKRITDTACSRDLGQNLYKDHVHFWQTS